MNISSDQNKSLRESHQERKPSAKISKKLESTVKQEEIHRAIQAIQSLQQTGGGGQQKVDNLLRSQKILTVGAAANQAPNMQTQRYRTSSQSAAKHGQQATVSSSNQGSNGGVLRSQVGRNGKSIKKTAKPRGNNAAQFQQQYMSLQQLQSQGGSNSHENLRQLDDAQGRFANHPNLKMDNMTSTVPINGLFTATNAQAVKRVPLLIPEAHSEETTLNEQMLFIRQNSQQSQQSQGSLDKRQGDNQQHRRRLVALAQAQQEKILSNATSHTMGIEESKEQDNGVQVISKKLISFREHSKDSGVHGEMAASLGQENTQNSHLQSNQKNSSNIASKGATLDPSNPTSQIATLSNGAPMMPAQEQLSPRKQGTETYGQAGLAGQAVTRAGGITSKSAGKVAKVPRLISGHPQRRMAQQQQEQNTNNNYQMTQQNQQQHALQSFNWRRQQQTFEPDDKPTGQMSNTIQAQNATRRTAHLTNSHSNSKRAGGLQAFQGQNQNSQQVLQTLPANSLDTQSLDELRDGNGNQARTSMTAKVSNGFQQRLKGQNSIQNQGANPLSPGTNENSTSNLQPVSGVLFHPHPLNKNVPSVVNQLQMNHFSGGNTQTSSAKDSARPHSQKQNQQMKGNNGGQMINNRTSRKNLRPINNGSKKPTPQIGQQKALIKGALTQKDNSISVSRERNLGIGGAGFSTNPNTDQNYATNIQVTNKNALFKFKKNSQTNRARMTGVEQNTSSSAGRNHGRPIVMRKTNNYMTATQQQQQQQLQQMRDDQIRIQQYQTGTQQSSLTRPQQPMKAQQIQMTTMQSQSGTQFKPSQTVVMTGLGELAQNVLRHDQSNEAFEQAQSARQSKASATLPKKQPTNGEQTTALANLTQNFNKQQQNTQSSQQRLQLLQNSDQQQTHSHQSLPLGNNKLIKVNKSKKMLDTARRSRIKQLDNKDSYNTPGAHGLNLANVNGQPISQFTISNQVASSATNKNSKGKQLITMNIQKPNFNGTMNPQQQRFQHQYGSLIQAQQATVGGSNHSSQVMLPPSQEAQGNKLQLNMNMGTQMATNAVKQSHTQKNTTVKLSQLPQVVNQLQQSSARNQNIELKTARDGQQIVQLVNKGDGGSQQQKIRRAQFKISDTNQGSVEKLQPIGNIQNIKAITKITETKEQAINQDSTNNVGERRLNPVESAVKIENQLVQEVEDTQTHSPNDLDLNFNKELKADTSNFQAAVNDLSEIEKEAPSKETALDGLNLGQALNEIIEEDTGQDLEGADPLCQLDPAEAAVQNEAKFSQTQQLTKQKQLEQSKKVLQIQNKLTDQRTTTDTNSNRKQNADSQQRTNINTSMQNIPRGVINTAFSLSSVASRDEVVPLPTTPQNILRYYIHELTDYEKGEVLDYEMVYFLGKNKSKKVDGKQQSKEQQIMEKSKDSIQNSSKSSDNRQQKDSFNYNYGYDDDKGDYKIVMGDHIGYRYEIVEFLGKGSFGTALRCIDHKEKTEVAVKIVKNKKKYYYQASVELKILQYLRSHDQEDIMNVIHIEDYVVFRKHLCMAFELLSMNLFEFLKINDFNGFDHNLIRRFAIQLLYALKYLKQLEIIHCDLKPENILLKEENKSGIKIIDFGSSTFVDEKVYTYIQSRFYRAPEIMLGIPYTPAIDMWSLGCIMAELYIGYPLFPGESENDQMSRIMEMRDVPPEDVLQVSERKMKFFTQNLETKELDPVMMKNSRGRLRKPNGKPLDYVIGDEDPDFNDFVTKCLDWNPEKRLTPDEALKHVWVLKGLPPQVLIHHQKMHNIATPELPSNVKMARDEFLQEQQREQELLQQQQQRITRQQKQGNAETKRDISQNPNVQRPHIQLKTPRSGTKPNQNVTNGSSEKNTNYPGTTKNVPQDQPPKINFNQGKKINLNQTGHVKPNEALQQQSKPKSLLRTDGLTGNGHQPLQQQSQNSQQQQSAQGNTRRKFLIKKLNKE